MFCIYSWGNWFKLISFKEITYIQLSWMSWLEAIKFTVYLDVPHDNLYSIPKHTKSDQY